MKIPPAISTHIMVAMLIATILAPLPLHAVEEKQPYRHNLVLGFDRPYSVAEVNNATPLFLYRYFQEELPHDLYAEFSILTTHVITVFGRKTREYFVGVSPQLNHTVYSGFHAYTNGVSDYRRRFQGHNAGVEAFFQYHFIKPVSLKLSYYPGWYFYRENVGRDIMQNHYEPTEIALPNNHWEHKGRADLVADFVTRRGLLDRIRHGVYARAIYEYARRYGYGTFEDLIPETMKSSISHTHKSYAELGLYYSFSNDITLLVDLPGAYHHNIDRNNSDKIGAFFSETAPMPGYFWGEFYHNKFATARAQIGLPLGVWHSRLQPGYNLLYLHKKNEVIGVGNYAHTVYHSVSASFTTKLGDVVPMMLNYAYGINAVRRDAHTRRLEKGNHEVLVMVIAAFGENPRPDGEPKEKERRAIPDELEGPEKMRVE
ncbi:MAG TPA: hypothetical protein PKM65_08520 [Spirochaetota bacterium]|nr:hypothetical protein [Spirochaetota bacterium]HNT12528.1 hypothetical protein [Spirochaetota bacterium]